MFNEYLYEIISTTVILLILILLFIFKKKSTSNNEQNRNTHLQEIYIEDNVEDENKSVEYESNELQEDPYDDISNGSEEGDFAKEIEPEPVVQENKSIRKRAVIKHGKITKQNFSEFSGERILVAEDNLINQKVLTGLLAGSGIELVMANDGQKALDILEKDNNFFMILMDANMPIVDGFEATRQIKANKKYDHIVVVALSGDTAADDLRKMSDAGMTEQLEKPLRMESLYEVIYAYTGNSRHNYNTDEYVEVIMTKELNGDKGLYICGGDENFYNEILNDFVTTYDNSTQELGELLLNDKLKEADALLLDIIGISANIGAEPLNEIAKDVKLALSDTQEKSYLTLVDQYKIHLDNLIKDIKNYL